MQHHRRHVILYTLIRALIRPFFYLRFNYTCERVYPKGKPFLLICNHTTLLDPAFVGLSFKAFTYPVASAHLSGKDFASKILDFIFAPIYRIKTSSDLTTVKKIVKTMKEGHNVCLFAEGQRTSNGVSLRISEATGKLVKLCKCSLVTYRLDGGYFTHPRWAKYCRRGKMYGHKVNEYSSEQLSKMSVEDINALIASDLYENAYEKQKTEMTAYKGKALAQDLESALYICPNCHALSRLHSHGDNFECDDCGMKLSMDEYGYMHPTDGYDGKYIDNVLGWDIWQKNKLRALSAEFNGYPADKAITFDENQYLSSNSSQDELSGALYCYKDRFTFKDINGNIRDFLFSDIVEIEGIGRMNMIFSTAKDVFTIKTKTPRSAFKYIDIYHTITSTPFK